MNNNNNTYGVSVNGKYVDVSNSLLGAKQYATRNGYNEVYKRHNNGYVVSLVTAKVTNKWVNQIKSNNMKSNVKTENAFDILESKYPTEFKKVYKKLSYQMLYHEAEILLGILEGKRNFGNPMSNNARWANNFMVWLGIDI